MPLVFPLINQAGVAAFQSLHYSLEEVRTQTGESVQFGFRHVLGEDLQVIPTEIDLRSIEVVEWLPVEFAVIVAAKWTPDRHGKFKDLEDVIQRNVRSWHDSLLGAQVFVNPIGR